MNSDRLSTVWAPGALGVLSVLRIFTGLALLQHGTGKIIGFPVAPMFANVQIDSLAGIRAAFGTLRAPLFSPPLFTPPASFFRSRLSPRPLFLFPCRRWVFTLR